MNLSDLENDNNVAEVDLGDYVSDASNRNDYDSKIQIIILCK